MSTTTTASAAEHQQAAREELKHALASRQAADGRVIYPARDADRIALACRRLQVTDATDVTDDTDDTADPRIRVIRTTEGVPEAVQNLERLSILPETVAGRVKRALKHAYAAMALRQAALNGQARSE